MIANRKITFAQFQHYKDFLREQEEERGSHAFVGFHVHEECVDAVNLHQSEVKPSYASILRRGTPSALLARGYALAAATLISIPPHPLAPTMKKHLPRKRKTLDENKLYLDSAATYHSMFCKRYT